MVQGQEYPGGDLPDVMERWGLFLPIHSGTLEHVGDEDSLRYDHISG
jgi:hypothetical protein